MYKLLHPTYFPPITHFVAFAQGEILLEACDNYQKQTYRNRAYIYGANGKQILSVPIKHTGNGGQRLYREVILEDNFNWKKQHWKTIQTAYRTSPFFEYYEDDLAPFFEKKHDSIFQMNLESIELIAECLQMEISFDFTERYQIDYTNLNDLRHLVDAKTPPNFGFDPYIQVFETKHGYMENLSILDLLFNEGPNALHYLQSQEL
ncbi:WbqC family protein [Robertkochia solimangrovi]|uniref:WbqC family protein n=1 Tax=Robertkochia solimangrovi TaxID=2213046 RepID=UPI00117D26E2|nr:WbqC family protein [Robertkochia solimangrovi]TRZ43584.1 hypothetical protein DMZ48_09185 [Robertkochia solimangrovi]